MSVPSIKLNLTHDERRALEEIAAQDMRRPDDALRWLLRSEMQRRQRRQERSNGAVSIRQDTHGAVVTHAG